MDLIPRRFYLDDIFDDIMVPERTNVGKCDIYEKDGKYHIEMDVPGYKKEEIKVDINNDYLTISAEKKTVDNDESKKYIRRERTYSKFERSFYLNNADEDKIDAEYKNGTLVIIVPKIDENKNKKQIEIR